MLVLLILTRDKYYGERILVQLHHQSLRNEFLRLLSEHKHQEAFHLAINKAQVHSYIPPGKELTTPPDFTFIEDQLQGSGEK